MPITINDPVCEGNHGIALLAIDFFNKIGGKPSSADARSKDKMAPGAVIALHKNTATFEVAAVVGEETIPAKLMLRRNWCNAIAALRDGDHYIVFRRCGFCGL